MSADDTSPAIEPQDQPIYHLTNVLNLPQMIVEGCVRARASAGPAYAHEIWPVEFLTARARCALPFAAGPSLDEFVPFTFCTKTPAVYNIATGYNGNVRRPNSDLVFLQTTTRRLSEALVPLASSDRLPLKRDVVFHAGTTLLAALDWELFRSGHFQNTESDQSRAARIAAELLAYRAVPLDAFDAIICWDKAKVCDVIEQAGGGCDLRVVADRRFYFPRGA